MKNENQELEELWDRAETQAFWEGVENDLS